MMAAFMQGFEGRFLPVFRGAKARCLWDSGPIGPIQLFWAFVSSGGFFGILGFRVPWVSWVSECPKVFLGFPWFPSFRGLLRFPWLLGYLVPWVSGVSLVLDPLVP